jgi:hypothetical protein
LDESIVCLPKIQGGVALVAAASLARSFPPPIPIHLEDV